MLKIEMVTSVAMLYSSHLYAVPAVG